MKLKILFSALFAILLLSGCGSSTDKDSIFKDETLISFSEGKNIWCYVFKEGEKSSMMYKVNNKYYIYQSKNTIFKPYKTYDGFLLSSFHKYYCTSRLEIIKPPKPVQLVDSEDETEEDKD